MQDSKDLDVHHIIESIQKKIENSTPDHKSNVNDKARRIGPKKTLKKNRYNVNPYSHIITDISSKSITFSPADDYVKIVIRSQAILINMSAKIKKAKPIGGTVSRCSVIEILKHYPQKDFYKVKFDISD
jgi:hypothetical protein